MYQSDVFVWILLDAESKMELDEPGIYWWKRR
jgi:hypothetical protein